MIDLERGVAQLKVDWNDTGIDIGGRGGDRGLRGIAFHGERILVAANAELLVLDQDFGVIESFRNPYLQHCHEISVANDRVFLTATGFDSVLMFDLATKRFSGGSQCTSAFRCPKRTNASDSGARCFRHTRRSKARCASTRSPGSSP